jgi:hypothetical protein
VIRLKPNPTFRFVAEFAVPGETEPAKINFVGRHLGQQALAAWAEKAGTLQGADLLEQVIGVVADWDGVAGEDGAPVPFSVEACRQLLDAYPGSPSVVALAYIGELSAARRKN